MSFPQCGKFLGSSLWPGEWGCQRTGKAVVCPDATRRTVPEAVGIGRRVGDRRIDLCGSGEPLCPADQGDPQAVGGRALSARRVGGDHLLRPCGGDELAASERLQQGVRPGLRPAAGPLSALRQGLSGAAALGRPQRELHDGVRGVRPDADEADAGEERG